jgi:hypothetical protein
MTAVPVAVRLVGARGGRWVVRAVIGRHEWIADVAGDRLAGAVIAALAHPPAQFGDRGEIRVEGDRCGLGDRVGVNRDDAGAVTQHSLNDALLGRVLQPADVQDDLGWLGCRRAHASHHIPRRGIWASRSMMVVMTGQRRQGAWRNVLCAIAVTAACDRWTQHQRRQHEHAGHHGQHAARGRATNPCAGASCAASGPPPRSRAARTTAGRWRPSAAPHQPADPRMSGDRSQTAEKLIDGGRQTGVGDSATDWLGHATQQPARVRVAPSKPDVLRTDRPIGHVRRTLAPFASARRLRRGGR